VIEKYTVPIILLLSMELMKKFSIITVCKNSNSYIEETILSVLNQTAVISNEVELEYIVIDGNSTDGTIEKINQLIENNKKIDWIFKSSVDKSMYEALSKGINACSGEVIGYINAGDLYNKHAFQIILDLIKQNSKVSWLTGLNVIYNDKSHIVGSTLPFKYRKRLIKSGFYGSLLPPLQQESTFWRKDLNLEIDHERLKELKYAGDAYIWNVFSNITEPTILNAQLGGFRIHEGQLSSNKKGYQMELQSFSKKATPIDYAQYIFDKLITHCPQSIKKIFNRNFLLFYNHEKSLWE
jgi:glycosyltransferase involved in cell wall biosynthesis